LTHSNNTIPPTVDIMENVHRYFATGVGLITTNSSKYGNNVMAVEWTLQIAYDPMLIAIFIHDSPTYWNIEETKVFGVNMASDEQSHLVNIAGGYSGTEIQKLNIPNTFETYPAKQINVLMINNCTLNAECKAITIQKIADHIMVVGEIIGAKFDDKKSPLIYTRGNYKKIASAKIAIGRKSIKINHNHLAEFKKISKGSFTLKAAVAVIHHRDKLLMVNEKYFDKHWMLPFVNVGRGLNYVSTLQKYLDSIGIKAEVRNIIGIERLMLTNSSNNIKSNDSDKKCHQELRANFITFDCKFMSLNEKVNEKSSSYAQWFDKPPKNTLLKILTVTRNKWK
jgi:flavin reductase (DIM6/NTAB) family NADH-FMN oxidoreductase RutF